MTRHGRKLSASARRPCLRLPRPSVAARPLTGSRAETRRRSLAGDACACELAPTGRGGQETGLGGALQPSRAPDTDGTVCAMKPSKRLCAPALRPRELWRRDHPPQPGRPQRLPVARLNLLHLARLLLPVVVHVVPLDGHKVVLLQPLEAREASCEQQQRRAREHLDCQRRRVADDGGEAGLLEGQSGRWRASEGARASTRPPPPRRPQPRAPGWRTPLRSPGCPAATRPAAAGPSSCGPPPRPGRRRAAAPRRSARPQPRRARAGCCRRRRRHRRSGRRRHRREGARHRQRRPGRRWTRAAARTRRAQGASARRTWGRCQGR